MISGVEHHRHGRAYCVPRTFAPTAPLALRGATNTQVRASHVVWRSVSSAWSFADRWAHCRASTRLSGGGLLIGNDDKGDGHVSTDTRTVCAHEPSGAGRPRRDGLHPVHTESALGGSGVATSEQVARASRATGNLCRDRAGDAVNAAPDRGCPRCLRNPARVPSRAAHSCIAAAIAQLLQRDPSASPDAAARHRAAASIAHGHSTRPDADRDTAMSTIRSSLGLLPRCRWTKVDVR